VRFAFVVDPSFVIWKIERPGYRFAFYILHFEQQLDKLEFEVLLGLEMVSGFSFSERVF